MANKMSDKGPSNKEINQKALQEEEEMAEMSKKKVKNGWGKTK